MSPARILVGGFAGALSLFLIALAAYEPPAARNVSSEPRAVLAQMVGSGTPHPLGSADNRRVREFIVERFVSMGYQVSLQTGWACSMFDTCGRPTNIIATPAGSSASTLQDAVLVAAHYDSVPAGPGASDDGVGASCVLALAAELKSRKTVHPVIFLVTDGEEPGLLGATLFAHEHELARHIKAAVNLEARGVSGGSLMFETGSANQWLMGEFGRAIARPMSDSLFYVMYRALPNNTDFTVFKRSGYQGYNFAYIGEVSHYHTPLDNLENANVDSIQHEFDNARGAVLALADAASLDAPSSEAVFFDVYSRALLAWSVNVNLVLAIAAAGLLAMVCVLLTRRGQLNPASLGFAMLQGLLALLLLTLLAGAAVAALIYLKGLPALAWVAHPRFMHLAVGGASLFSMAVMARFMRKRSDALAAWLGGALLLALIALALAIVVPGTSFVPLLPSLAAALFALPLLFGREPNAGRLLAVWLTAVVGAPVVLFCYAGLGVLGFVTIAFFLGLANLLATPLLVPIEVERWRALAVRSGLAVFCVGFLAALFAPTYSAKWPLRLNFAYRLDADAGHADWLATPSAHRLPAAVAAAAIFSEKAQSFSGVLGESFTAQAPLLSLPAPQLSLLSVERHGAEATYHLHFTSPRGASDAFLTFPDAAAVREVRVGEVAHTNGGNWLGLMGLPPDGVDFSVEAKWLGTGAFTVRLVDQSYGLPAGGEFLTRSRTKEATSSQEGDITVVQHSVTF
jgi:hypothetical protein